MTKRYTAVLKIVEIDEPDRESQPRRHQDGNGKHDSELLSVTLRSKSLEGLKAHLTAHVALVPIEE